MGSDAMSGATVTITGGTGSFGSTMVSHLLTRGVDAVRISAVTRPSRMTCASASRTRV